MKPIDDSFVSNAERTNLDLLVDFMIKKYVKEYFDANMMSIMTELTEMLNNRLKAFENEISDFVNKNYIHKINTDLRSLLFSYVARIERLEDCIGKVVSLDDNIHKAHNMYKNVIDLLKGPSEVFTTRLELTNNENVLKQILDIFNLIKDHINQD